MQRQQPHTCEGIWRRVQNRPMHVVFQALAFVLRKLVKFFFIALGLAVVAALLAIGLAALVFVVLRALLTGRMPRIATTISRFRQAARPFQNGSWSAGSNWKRAPATDVVDVEATEVASVRIDHR